MTDIYYDDSYEKLDYFVRYIEKNNDRIVKTNCFLPSTQLKILWLGRNCPKNNPIIETAPSISLLRGYMTYAFFIEKDLFTSDIFLALSSSAGTVHSKNAHQYGYKVIKKPNSINFIKGD